MQKYYFYCGIIFTATILMDEDITIILQKQAEALPSEIRKYIASGEWEQKVNTITQKFNLSDETASVLGREIMLALTGLVHPGVFRGEFASDISDLDDTTIDTIVAEVNNSIFQPILPILEKFFKEQDSAPEPTPVSVTEIKPEPELQHEKEKITIPAPPSLVAPRSVWEKKPEVIPENLPTGEIAVPQVVAEITQSTIPTPLVPSPSEQLQSGILGTNEQTHPFEEKMKKVFTGGVVDRGGLVLDQKQTGEPVLTGEPIKRPSHDPYREPIE